MAATSRGHRFATFYSYKGGVGRTMAVANVAWRLADKHGLRVVAVDWDLEAPGLHAFFGLSAADLSEQRGVLDYFLEWQASVERKAASAPDVREWLLPVTRRPFAPRHGSLSLLVAGRQDEAFVKRLHDFDWKHFYETSGGGTAVETLRSQLSECADVVLIDSRTGLTDMGGACTVQVPDLVVLMLAPNEVSLRGTESVARGLAHASVKDRGGRNAPRVWLSICRVPVVEEHDLTKQWFAKHESWFTDGARSGLWRREDHPKGLRTFEVPHRARWTFGERLLHDAAGSDASDPLDKAYDGLAADLNKWSHGDQTIPAASRVARPDEVAELEARVRDAEKRGDPQGLGLALNDLGHALRLSGRFDEALRLFQRAADVVLGQGDKVAYAFALNQMGSVRRDQRNWDEALELFEQALAMAREAEDREGEALTLSRMGIMRTSQRKFDDALALHMQALAIHREMGSRRDEGIALHGIGTALLGLRKWEDALAAYDQSLAVAREVGDDVRWEAAPLRGIGNVRSGQGKWEEALEAFEVTLAIDREVGDRRGEVFTLHGIGVVRLGQCRWEEALVASERALAIVREVDDRQGEGAVRFLVGKVLWEKGETEKALESYETALSIARETNYRWLEARILRRQGNALGAQGRTAEATALLSHAITMFAETNDPFRAREAAAKLDELRAELRPLAESTARMVTLRLWESIEIDGREIVLGVAERNFLFSLAAKQGVRISKLEEFETGHGRHVAATECRRRLARRLGTELAELLVPTVRGEPYRLREPAEIEKVSASARGIHVPTLLRIVGRSSVRTVDVDPRGHRRTSRSR